MIKLSGCERNANAPVSRTSSLSSATEISDDSAGEGDTKEQSSSDIGTSYSALVVVRRRKSNAHPLDEKAERSVKKQENTSRTKTPIKRENLSKSREYVGRMVRTHMSKLADTDC